MATMEALVLSSISSVHAPMFAPTSTKRSYSLALRCHILVSHSQSCQCPIDRIFQEICSVDGARHISALRWKHGPRGPSGLGQMLLRFSPPFPQLSGALDGPGSSGDIVGIHATEVARGVSTDPHSALARVCAIMPWYWYAAHSARRACKSRRRGPRAARLGTRGGTDRRRKG